MSHRLASKHELAANSKRRKPAIRARRAVTHVMQEKESEAEAFVLMRGAYDKRGDRVTPATPAVLPAMARELPRNRLGLAQVAAASGASPDRPRHGEPFLAGSLRHRPRS